MGRSIPDAHKAYTRHHGGVVKCDFLSRLRCGANMSRCSTKAVLISCCWEGCISIKSRMGLVRLASKVDGALLYVTGGCFKFNLWCSLMLFRFLGLQRRQIAELDQCGGTGYLPTGISHCPFHVESQNLPSATLQLF